MITQEELKELFDYSPDAGVFIRKTNVRGASNKNGFIKSK